MATPENDNHRTEPNGEGIAPNPRPWSCCGIGTMTIFGSVAGGGVTDAATGGGGDAATGSNAARGFASSAVGSAWVGEGGGVGACGVAGDRVGGSGRRTLMGKISRF